MCPRYLSDRLDSSDQGKSWSRIRSTLGVSRLVPGRSTALVAAGPPTRAMFHSGDSVVIADGQFVGIGAI